MLTITVSDAQARFSQLLKHAKNEPVQVVDNNEVVGVFVPPADYEQMRQFYIHRLNETLDASGREVAQSGFTEQELERLLSVE
jgi:prevent-host-death family protein